MKAVIVGGCRTPFVKSGTLFRELSAIELGKIAVRELMDRTGVPGEAVDQIIYGTVIITMLLVYGRTARITS